MSDVDNLIGELFPNGGTAGNAAVSSSSKRQSDWDDSSDEESKEPHGCKRTPQINEKNCMNGEPRRTTGHSFDDDDDDESDVEAKKGGLMGCSSNGHRLSLGSVRQPASPSKAVIFPVPFPSLADASGAFSCPNRCYVTNSGVELKGGHPTLGNLLRIAADETALSRQSAKQVMLQKGAFYAVQPSIGNGSVDNGGSASGDGGCANILCHKCNYIVIRLQGAEWVDNGGVLDLYLTLRNYYPDWSRLASSRPIGVEEDIKGASRRLVLQENSAAAAYCCQCSWLTVKSARETIETRVTDAVTLRASEGGCLFATTLPLLPSEKRRPPLWACHGHSM